MKKILLLIVLLSSFCFASFAQNLTLSNAQGSVPNGTIITIYGDTSETLIVHMKVTNSSASNMDVKLRKKHISVVAGSEVTFCWGGSCWGASTYVSPDPTTINAGATDSTNFAGDYKAKGHIGVSTVMFTFFDMNNANDSVCFIAVFDCSLSSVQDIKVSADISGAYPNPADKYTYINYSLTALDNTAKVVIHDMMGSEVANIPVTEKEGKLRIDTYSFPAGVYFYSFILNNRIYNTRKLVVSHR